MRRGTPSSEDLAWLPPRGLAPTAGLISHVRPPGRSSRSSARSTWAVSTRSGLNLAAPALFAHGTEEQRLRFLPPIVRNEEALVPALQ